MLQVEDGERFFLEAEEWINKTSGRGTVRILKEDESVKVDWHAFLAGSMCYEDVFKALLPWATFTPDYDVYSEHAQDEYIDENGHWDKESQEYFYDEHECREFVESRCSGVRPYTAEMGEVARYRLELGISEVGRAFLVRDES